MILSSFTICFCVKICCLKKKIYDDIFIYSVTQKQHSSVKTTAGHLSESAKFGTTLRERKLYMYYYLCATVGKRGTGWVRSLHVSQLFALIVLTSLTFCATALVWEMLQGNKSDQHKPTLSLNLTSNTVGLKDTQGKKSLKGNSGENIYIGLVGMPKHQNEKNSSRE